MQKRIFKHAGLRLRLRLHMFGIYKSRHILVNANKFPPVYFLAVTRPGPAVSEKLSKPRLIFVHGIIGNKRLYSLCATSVVTM